MKLGARSSEFRGFKTKRTILYFFILVAIVFLSGSLSFAFGSEKWIGVDESVVEKFAKEHGREVREPLMNTDQGDLLLFLFLLAGAIGGFVGGYYWRILIFEKSPKVIPNEQKITRWPDPEEY